MMKISNLFKTLFILPFLMIVQSCNDTFLDAKPKSEIVIPASLEECQRLLDNNSVLNSLFPALGELGSDEYYTNYESWQSTIYELERHAYVWDDDIYGGENKGDDWSDSFNAIYVANVVLDVLNEIGVTDANRSTWNNIKGSALFFRAYRYFGLAESYTMPYNEQTAGSLPGLPLKDRPQIDEIKPRSTLQNTYQFILSDLNESVLLLSDDQPGNSKNRPSKAAAYALMARIYLAMNDYQKALEASDNCLHLYKELLNYNTLTVTADRPFDIYNKEILMWGLMKPYGLINIGSSSPNSLVDPDLIASYAATDLRLKAFFSVNQSGKATRKRMYSGTFNQCFYGLATDEVHLIQAECRARNNDIEGAMESLNNLLKNRFPASSFVPAQAADKEQAVALVLRERRKELPFRGSRWSDVRRLNELGSGITMSRKLNDQTFLLNPGSLKFAWLIPFKEIALSGIEQNPR